MHHGKGPCDGSTGRVKQRIVNLVKTETVVIKNTNVFFDACMKHLESSKTEGSCSHNIQEFEFPRKLATMPNTGAWTTVPDTCKVHNIMNVVGTKKINIKRFLCTCGPCIHGGDKSENQICPDIWHGFDLVKKKFVHAQFDK